MSNRTELEEISHTGGKVSFDVKVDPQGGVSYSVRSTHSRPTPAAIFAVYAIQQGVAVDDIQLGGIGTPWNPPPLPGCFPVFISSDSTGMFGHQCPVCKGYWRADHGGKLCPYCAYKADKHYQFLTEAQQRYVKEYCDLLRDALHVGQAGKHTIDMDAVAEAVGKSHAKPAFYYAEERQQNLFRCVACGELNDILGRYAYCGSCGTRNDLQELEKIIRGIRDRANAGGPYEACVKEAVAAFDSFAAQYAKQLVARVPLTPARKSRIERAHYHNLATASEIFRAIFDIDIQSGFSADDIAFITLMLHRRHVYEHKGGEADEKYIAHSGDHVRLKQALRETQESAHRTASLVIKLATNLQKGFHEIFPPLEEPIRWYDRTKRQSQPHGAQTGSPPTIQVKDR
jgi:hypothetical protein